MKKVLIIDNGGIARSEDDIKLTNNSTGAFLINLQTNNILVTFMSYLGDIENNKFLYTFNLNKNNIKSFIFKGKRPYVYIYLIKFLFLLLKHKYIYVFYPGGMSKITYRLCKILNKKYGLYVRGNGLYITEGNDEANNGSLFNEKMIRNAEFIITVSDHLKQKLEEMNERKISVIKPMLSYNLNNIVQKEIAGKDCWHFLFVGSLIELKGVEELIETARILYKNKISFQLDIIGDGKLYYKLSDKINENELMDFVFLHGGISNSQELEKFYEKADAFIFPSRNEGFPRVLYEAMLKSLPIFTTMVGGIPGLMKDKYNCFEIPVRDPEGQAKIIVENINKLAKLQKVAENGQKTVTEVLKNRKPHHEVLLNCLKN